MLLRIEIIVLKVTVPGIKNYIFRLFKKHKRTRSAFKEKCKHTFIYYLYTITSYNILRIYNKMEQSYRGSFVSKICHCCQRGRKISFMNSKEGVSNQCQRRILLIKLTLLATWVNIETHSLNLVHLNRSHGKDS